MDENEFKKRNEEFRKWMADVGKLNEVCANGKTFVVNPEALTTFMQLTNFFKKKSDAHVKECEKCGLEGKPYLIETLPTKPWLHDVTLTIRSQDEDEIDFSAEDIKFLHNAMNEKVIMTFSGTTKPERFQIWFVIEDYFMKSNP